jgi:hypothetical protein
MHRAFTDRGQDRSIADSVIDTVGQHYRSSDA